MPAIDAGVNVTGHDGARGIIASVVPGRHQRTGGLIDRNGRQEMRAPGDNGSRERFGETVGLGVIAVHLDRHAPGKAAVARSNKRDVRVIDRISAADDPPHAGNVEIALVRTE